MENSGYICVCVKGILTRAFYFAEASGERTKTKSKKGEKMRSRLNAIDWLAQLLNYKKKQMESVSSNVHDKGYDTPIREERVR